MAERLLVFLLLIVVVTTQATPKEFKMDAEKRLQIMTKLSKTANDPFITLSNKTFTDLVKVTDRAYDVVTLFTVPRGMKEHSDQVFDAYLDTIYSFQKQTHKLNRPLFFAVIYPYKNDKAIYDELQFTEVPHLTLSVGQQEQKENQPLYPPGYDWFIKSNSQFSTQGQIDFINKLLNTNIERVVPITQIIQNNIGVFILMIVLMYCFKYIKIVFSIPEAQYTVALSVYSISCGGIVYGLIHNNPWFKFAKDSDGKWFVEEYFMKAQHGQWSGEGFLFTGLLALLGFALIGLTQMKHFCRTQMQLRIAMLVNLALVWVLWKAVIIVYQYKQPWYDPKFYPVDHYKTGPLMVDQGNTI